MESDTIDCSSFDPAWTFNDDFVDCFQGRGQVWLDAAGRPIRAIEHIVHRSNDVNSATGFTLHEHNHFVAQIDFVRGTVTLNGAINIMQRPGAVATVPASPSLLPAVKFVADHVVEQLRSSAGHAASSHLFGVGGRASRWTARSCSRRGARRPSGFLD